MKIVRDGYKVWPYCVDCGCRLDINEYTNSEYMLTHFGLHMEKDARGHKCRRRFDAWIVPKYKLAHLEVA